MVATRKSAPAKPDADEALCSLAPCDASAASRLVYAAVSIDYFAVGMMRTLLPYFGQQLGGTPFTQGLLEALYGAGQVIGSLVLGRWSDGRGRKPGLAISFGGSALGYALVAVAVSGVAGEYSLWLLLLSRLPVGLSKQTITISRAVLADLTPRAGRSAAMQTLYSAMALGYIAGPSVGGWLGGAGSGGGSALPAVVACAVFVALLPVVALFLRETCPRRAAAPRADAPRAGAVSVLRAEPRLLALIAAQWLPECAFVGFTSTALGAIAHGGGWSPAALGGYNSAWAVLALGVSFALGALPVERVGDGARLAAGYLAFVAACVGLACYPTADALWPALPGLAVAVAVVRTAPAALLSRAAPPSAQGEALGALDAANSFGRIVAPLAIGALYARAGQRAALGACAALTLVGLLTLARAERGARAARAAGASEAGGPPPRSSSRLRKKRD